MIKLAKGVFIMLILNFSCVYFLSGCSSGTSGEAIKINKATIKFIPPEGWRKSVPDPYTMSYLYTKSMNYAALNISYLRIPLAAGPQADSVIMSHMQEAQRDKSVLSLDWTTCAGEKALRIFSLSYGKKKEGLWFSKEGDLFTVWFTASDEKFFSELLPIVEKSLKTLKIVSIVPKKEEYGPSIFSGKKSDVR